MIGLARRAKTVTLFAACSLTLAACGGGSDGDDVVQTPTNSPPTANAGADQAVFGNAVVQLAGSGSDPDGDTLTFRWSQTAGPNVTLSNADNATASFTAPDVVGADQLLRFEVEVSDGANSATDSVSITVQEGMALVTVSGKVNYEFVPPNANCRGLDFGSIETRPIRGATVQLIDADTGSVIDSTVSSDTGDYSFADVTASTDVRLRVRAELKRAGLPGWDVEVRDNFIAGASDADVPAPPPLATRALYVLDGSNFNTGGANVERDLLATTGWTGTAYTQPRAAAPFAILDAIYTAVQFVLTADADAGFAPLDAFWSVNNTRPVTQTDITAGQLGASFYRSDIDSLFLLGDVNVDTEEFDDHVVVHEWAHYFEDTFSRSDSIGGPHAIGDQIDARLAFGEGWATAFAAMALDNTLYCDTGPAGSTGGFGIGADAGSYKGQGWYDEISVVRFLYDLYDTTNEVEQVDGVLAPGTDSGSIGWQPIYDVMTGPQAFTPAFTTVFSFATELKNTLADQADRDLVDEQLAREFIDSVGLDIYGTNETNDADGRDVLPIYTELTPDGSVTSLCVNSDFDPARDGNKLAEYRYLRFEIVNAGFYDVTVTTQQPTTPPLPPDDPNDVRDQSDPDIIVFRDGTIVAFGISGVANSETFTTQNALQPGVHVADLQEFRFEDPQTAAGFPEQVCFDVSISP